MRATRITGVGKAPAGRPKVGGNASQIELCSRCRNDLAGSKRGGAVERRSHHGYGSEMLQPIRVPAVRQIYRIVGKGCGGKGRWVVPRHHSLLCLCVLREPRPQKTEA